jgi:hypothetical protein
MGRRSTVLDLAAIGEYALLEAKMKDVLPAA